MRKIVHPLIAMMVLPLLSGQAALPAPPQSGSRAFMTGARLVQLCQTENPYCTGYIAGVASILWRRFPNRAAPFAAESHWPVSALEPSRQGENKPSLPF